MIELIELFNFLAAPSAVKHLCSEFQAISASGDVERCEDMDFILENLKKKSKAWISRGVPTPEEWLRIFRNLSKFEKLRSAVLNRTSSTVDTQQPYTSSHHVREEDVTAWKTHLRENEFLLLLNRNESGLKSVSKADLDDSLATLTEQAMERRRSMAKLLFKDARTQSRVHSVFVTSDGRDHYTDISYQTKNVISQRVLASINSLDDESIKTMLLGFY